MSGGFGAGFIKGALLSLAVAATASLILPLPAPNPAERPQTDLSTPAGSGFNAVRPDTNPVLPVGEPAVGKEPVQQPRPDARASEAARAAPAIADTTPAARPDAGPGGITLPGVAPDGGSRIALGTTGAGAGADGDGRTLPQRTAPRLAGSPAGDNPAITRPAPVAPPPSPPTTEIARPPAPEGGDVGAQGTSAAVIAGAAAPGEGSGMVGKSAAAGKAARPQKALVRNATPFSNPDHLPMLAVILIDAGDEGLSNEVLRSFDFPVSFALDPDRVGATAKAKILRRGKLYEIVALAPGQLTDPDSIETPQRSLEKTFATLPESVALLERAAHQFDAIRGLGDRIIPLLGQSGHGLITRDRNDDSAYGRARRAGIAVGSVYRVLDGARESGIVIKRYLNRAALEATRRGRIIVVGHTYPETVTALFSWAVSQKPANVLLAPVSAVLGSR